MEKQRVAKVGRFLWGMLVFVLYRRAEYSGDGTIADRMRSFDRIDGSTA